MTKIEFDNFKKEIEKKLAEWELVESKSNEEHNHLNASHAIGVKQGLIIALTIVLDYIK